MATEFSTKVMQKALRAKPWIRKVGPRRYRVTPRTDAHGKYELTHSYDEEGSPVIETCIEVRTKDPCLGFYFSGNCYHGAALAKHLTERQERQAA